MSKLSLKDLSLKGKRVLMRVDFNVPLSKDGKITDDSRIKKALPSIKYIQDQGASLILLSHLGRPKGENNPALSLAPCAKRLSKLLDTPVTFVPACVGEKITKMAKALKPKQILLLENTRFYPAETSPEKDLSFAKNLAKLGNVYINDAFGTAHRKHSSTHTICQYFPKNSAMGFLMEDEIKHLNSILHPSRPFYAIIGGAKVSSKIGVLTSLIEKVDSLFIGGAMAHTFFVAQNIPIGDSLFEESEIITCKEILSRAKKLGISIFLPEDMVISDQFSEEGIHKVVSMKKGFKPPYRGMDIGPKTIKTWKENMLDSSTIFWNGPLGVFEMKSFNKGTLAIAEFLSKSSATTVIGGGDSIAAIHSLKLENSFSHLSTGGGASLEFLEFGTLPAIEALTEAN